MRGPAPACSGALLALAVLVPVAAGAQTAGGYGDLADWIGWARTSPGERAGLASSFDPWGGDADANHYEAPPGLWGGDIQTIAARIAGPGIIYRFWMPHRTASDTFALRMYFDGETAPRIDTNSAELLGGALSAFAPPLLETAAGGQVSYEPIAFRDSVRIETENRAGLWHWYQYSYRTFPPGTALTSYTGTPDAEAQAARDAAAAMLQNAGQHPAGSAPGAQIVRTGPLTVPAGATLTVADLSGPGVVRSLAVRMAAASDADLDSLVLRVTWDGDPDPAIDAPVGWFFGAGHGRAPYRSLPLGTDGPDGFYCYWPMPFRTDARFELFNASAAAIAVDSVRVEHQPGPVAPDLGTLHATAATTVLAPGHDGHVLLSVNGAGHFVGNLLYSQEDHDTFFFLEGDDILTVDGVTVLNGTGLEDAYNGGHYYNWVPNPMPEPEGPNPPFAFRPLSGILAVEKTATPPFARADQYRWRIGDRVAFRTSLEVRVETKGYGWAPGRHESVAFWYRLPPAPTGVRPPTGPGGGAASGPALELFPPAPNPAGRASVIRFRIRAPGRVRVDVLDVRGRRIATVLDEDRAAGLHAVTWSPDGQTGGVYFVRVRGGGSVATRKLVLFTPE